LNYTALVPDFFALPWQQGEVSLAILGERCLARTGAWQGMAGPAALVLPLLQQQLASGQQRLTVYGEGDFNSLAPQLLAGATRADHRQLFSSVRQPWLAIAGGDSSRDRAQTQWPLPGKIAAGLAVLAVALSAAATVLETAQIEQQASHFDEQLQRGYRQYFGENYDFDMADFQRVVSARMDGGNRGDPALGQLQQLQQILSACGDCRIDKLSASGAGVEALVSGQNAARLVASGEGRVEQRNNQWVITLGGEDE
jgi:type II secretory pathway component PulL